jgi:hypothetical protein
MIYVCSRNVLRIIKMPSMLKIMKLSMCLGGGEKENSLKCCNTIGAFYNVKWDFTFKETLKLK